MVDITPRSIALLEKTTAPIEHEAGWAPETVSTVWIREIYLALVGF
jgi:hypothetical protein